MARQLLKPHRSSSFAAGNGVDETAHDPPRFTHGSRRPSDGSAFRRPRLGPGTRSPASKLTSWRLVLDSRSDRSMVTFVGLLLGMRTLRHLVAREGGVAARMRRALCRVLSKAGRQPAAEVVSLPPNSTGSFAIAGSTPYHRPRSTALATVCAVPEEPVAGEVTRSRSWDRIRISARCLKRIPPPVDRLRSPVGNQSEHRCGEPVSRMRFIC